MATNDNVMRKLDEQHNGSEGHRKSIADKLHTHLDDLANRIDAIDGKLDPALHSIMKSRWTPLWVLLYTLASVAVGFKLNALL